MQSTQGALHAKSPLEPHGAAALNVILHSNQYIRRNGKDRTTLLANHGTANYLSSLNIIHVPTALCSSSLMNIPIIYRVRYKLKFFLVCCFLFKFYCRGGDDTQRDANAAVPLEPHDAAEKCYSS